MNIPRGFYVASSMTFLATVAGLLLVNPVPTLRRLVGAFRALLGAFEPLWVLILAIPALYLGYRRWLLPRLRI